MLCGTNVGYCYAQVVMHSNFQGFPEEAITVEFWMLSTDSCRSGAASIASVAIDNTNHPRAARGLHACFITFD